MHHEAALVHLPEPTADELLGTLPPAHPVDDLVLEHAVREVVRAIAEGIDERAVGAIAEPHYLRAAVESVVELDPTHATTVSSGACASRDLPTWLSRWFRLGT